MICLRGWWCDQEGETGVRSTARPYSCSNCRAPRRRRPGTSPSARHRPGRSGREGTAAGGAPSPGLPISRSVMIQPGTTVLTRTARAEVARHRAGQLVDGRFRRRTQALVLHQVGADMTIRPAAIMSGATSWMAKNSGELVAIRSSQNSGVRPAVMPVVARRVVDQRGERAGAGASAPAPPSWRRCREDRRSHSTVRGGFSSAAAASASRRYDLRARAPNLDDGGAVSTRCR